ncbi:hypothetical protein GH5_00198 [Leishmania sp. Ghana 2012 LV757]|uniref:hypothetical protein n=1 Tax=Leishmania sp. Ghana 2012 LV757 TaxID=2803181 RepID=UPI001B770E61|nr:hypothetical protein GH5_00198 [Leishmania sp. Ghana 2012 LV757]
MRHRDASVRPHWSPAASTGESSTKASPAPPPVISTVCVDVRELLRCSAANSKDTSSDAGASISDRSQAAAVALPEVHRQSPRQQQANPPLFQKSSTFWSPSYPPLGGFAINSGPPPLSPTDATILHSILDEPSIQATVRSGSAGIPGVTSTPLAQKPRTRRPTLASDAAVPPSAASFVRRFSANTCPPPHDDLSTRSTSADAEDSHHLSRVDTATPFSMLSEEGTCLQAPLPGIQGRLLNRDGSNSAGAAASTGLSPAAQRTIRGILGQLGSCSRERATADDGVMIDIAKGAYCEAAVAPLVPFHKAALRASAAGLSAASPFLSSSAFAREIKGRSAAAVWPAAAQLWRLCPALAGSTFSRMDARQNRSQDTVQGVLAPQRGLTHNRPHASADRSAVPLLKSSRSPRRTVPPAFRRHLQFTEAAPTTRRPKRK